MLPTDYRTTLAMWLIALKKKHQKGFMQQLRNKGGLHCPGETVMGQDMHAYAHVFTFICIYMYASL